MIPFLIYSPVFLSGFDNLPLDRLVLIFVPTVFLSLKYLLSYLTVMVFLLFENLDPFETSSLFLPAFSSAFYVRLPCAFDVSYLYD